MKIFMKYNLRNNYINAFKYKQSYILMLKFKKLIIINYCIYKIMMNVKTFKINMSNNMIKYINLIIIKLI